MKRAGRRERDSKGHAAQHCDRCGPHLIALAVNGTLASFERSLIGKTLTRLRGLCVSPAPCHSNFTCVAELVNTVLNSKKKLGAFRDEQRRMGVHGGRIRTPQLDNTTRWWSILRMVESYIRTVDDGLAERLKSGMSVEPSLRSS